MPLSLSILLGSLVMLVLCALSSSVSCSLWFTFESFKGGGDTGGWDETPAGSAPAMMSSAVDEEEGWD